MKKVLVAVNHKSITGLKTFWLEKLLDVREAVRNIRSAIGGSARQPAPTPVRVRIRK